LKVELVRAWPGAVRRHEIALTVEEEGFPPEAADKVRDVFDRQSQRKGKIMRLDGAGTMQDPGMAGL
jgi:hypothetical protein